MTRDNPLHPVRTPDMVRAEIAQAKSIEGMTWRRVASLPQYSGIPPGTLCAIAKGASIPKNYRKQLGVPMFVMTEPCPIHGVVHDYDCTTQVVKPLRKQGKPRAPRIAIRKDAPVSAARTIVNNMEPAAVKELVVMLKFLTNG